MSIFEKNVMGTKLDRAAAILYSRNCKSVRLTEIEVPLVNRGKATARTLLRLLNGNV
jgi:hypothetical protein